MNGVITKYISKLFIQQWIIGLSPENAGNIIRSKKFDPDITWINEKSADKFYADPFIFKAQNGKYHVLLEDYSFTDTYGKIAVMELDENLSPIGSKILLDTKSHLSYPFIFNENNTTYVFPESAQSGKLACYQYDSVNRELVFLKDIIELPLLDSTILKHSNKYWLFATIKGKESDSKLYLYFSDNLLGPYAPHCKNPVQSGIGGSRPAGNIIKVDDVYYRPSQNSKYTYGGSITLNKINVLNENDYSEEFYMQIAINGKNKLNKGMHGLHTLNTLNGVMVVDGTRWRFSPATKLKQWAMKFRNNKTKK